MKDRKSPSEERAGSPWFKALRGALLASILSTALVAAFAFTLQKQWLGVESIGTVNVVIKLVSAAAAALSRISVPFGRYWLSAGRNRG